MVPGRDSNPHRFPCGILNPEQLLFIRHRLDGRQYREEFLRLVLFGFLPGPCNECLNSILGSVCWSARRNANQISLAYQFRLCEK